MNVSSISKVGPHASPQEALSSDPSIAVCSNSVCADFSKFLRVTGHDQVTRGDGSVESKLTGMLLGNLFQLMMPKEAGGLFGNSGNAGMWDSYFSEAIANNVNQSGKICLRIDRS